MPNPKIESPDYWKSTILKIDNRKILEYIRELCSARLDIGRADERVEETKEVTGQNSMPNGLASMYEPRKVKLKPMGIPLEEENMDKIS